MAQNFNINARITLQGPGNVRAIVRSIQSQLNSITANVTLNIASGTSSRINALNTSLQRVNVSLLSIRTSSDAANVSLLNLANTLRTVRGLASRININVNARQATQQINDFGGQAALAVRRFAAFAVPTTLFLGLVAAIKEGVSAAIDFEKEMIRLSQVTGKSVSALGELSSEITHLATSLGTSSKDLSIVATTIAQAGLNARDTKIALDALAKSSLAATFDNIQETTEGAIAVFQQFEVQAADLQGVIGSLNAVSAQFAVESDDLVSVIRRTGGAFKASGGNLNELLGLFTSVRATTRESADSIATGFRTIFTRVQRPRTIQFLKELGVTLQDAKGQFIGPLESIRRLNAALSEIPSTDPRFAAVIEELGGFRQVSKVIPLIQQFPEALKAISVAEQGQQSIVEDSVTAQKSLANQIVKVKEEFLSLFREITGDKSLQLFVKEILGLAKGLIEVTRAIKPLIPLIGSIALIGGVQGISSLGGSFVSGLAGGGGRRRFAKGGVVPGSGNGDTVPAMLTPGEFVVRKKAAQAIGFDKLARMNRFAKGGPVEEFGIAALYPAGIEKDERFTHTTRKGGKNKVTKDVHIQIRSLQKKESEKLQNIYKNKIYSAVSQSADVMQRTLGIERSQPRNIQPILKKSGLDNVVGNLFEGSLAVAGAPYDDKASSRSPLDFPGGLGRIAPLFGLPTGLQSDAKARATSEDFIRSGRNLDNYLINKYGNETPKKTQSAADELKQGSDRASAATYLNNLPNDKKAVVRNLIANSKKGRWSSTQAALSPYGLRYLREGDAKAIKFASGGKAPGSGSKDNVPALLTPGEFVINKKAANRIGLSNLTRLNKADKVQKFASGGSVPRGGIISRNEGAGFALAGAASLASSFIKLDGEAQKLVAAFSGIAAVSAGLSIGIRSIADDTRLRRARFAGGGALGSPRNNSPLNVATRTLARNFDGLVTSTAALSGIAIILGQNMQDAALSSAKTAKDQNELSAALRKDSTGSITSNAGIGAGIGAAVGTFIAPGIGTAIGAGLGGITGGIVGALNNNNKELIKAFNQAGFDKVDEKIGDAFDDFSSKRVGASASALNIGQLARQQLSTVKGTADIEQRAELTKQLRSNLTNYRALSTSIVENVSSFDEFANAYGGAGRNLVESIAYLTNKSFPEIRKQIENEIEARKTQIESARQQALANAQIKVFTVSMKSFSDAIVNVNEKIGETQNSLDQLITSIEGGSSSSKFNSISGDLFSRASSGSVQDVGRVASAARNLTASLDARSINSISENAISVTKLTNALPLILEDVSKGVGLGADTDRADELFSGAIDRLGGVTEQMKSIAKSIFVSELASRENSGDSGFKKVVREDLIGLADKLVPEALKASVQELDKVNSTIQNIISTVGERLSKQSQIELSIAKQRAEIEDRIFEVAKLRLAAGREVTQGSVQANDTRRRSILLGGGPALGAAVAGNRILGLVRARENAQNQINTAGVGTAAQQKALSDFAKFDSEIQRLTAYMKDLSSSTIELALLQDKLGKAEADRQSGKSLVEKLLFGDGKDRVKFAGAVQNIGDVNAGKKNLIDLPKEQRDAVLELIREAPQNRESGLFGGKKPEDFLNEQLRKNFNLKAVREGANVPAADQLAKELTTRTKEEDAIRAELIKVQQAMVDAELELIKVNDVLSQQFASFNTKLVSDLPGLIKNAILESSIATLGQQKQFITGQRNEAGAKVQGVRDLAAALGIDPRGVQELGRTIEANAANFAKFKEGTDLQNNAIPINQRTRTLASDLANANAFAKQNTFAGRTSVTEENAANIATKISESDNLLNNKDFLNTLQKRLQGTVFGSGAVKGQGNDRFTPNAFGVVQTGGDKGVLEEAIKFIINDEVNKFKNGLIDKGFDQAKEARENLNKALVPKVGQGNADRLIGQLSQPEQMKKFLDTFQQVNEPFDRLSRNLDNLNAQVAAAAATMATLNGQRVNIAPNKAIGRASGGIVNGRHIRSQLTTFTPKGTDKIPAMLSDGEFVVNAQAAKANMGTLQAMNFARGGKISAADMKKRQDAYKQRRTTENLKAKARNERDYARGSAGEYTPSGDAAVRNANAKYIFEQERQDRNFKIMQNNNRPTRDGVSSLIGGAVGGFFGAVKSASGEFNNYHDLKTIAHDYENTGILTDDVKKTIKGLTDNQKRLGSTLYQRRKRQPFSTSGGFKGSGAVLGFATGGPVPGSGNKDNVPALLTPGEFVLNRRATKSLGLNSLANFNQKFANGGVVTGGGGASGGMLNLNPQALATLEKFYGTFTDVVNQFGSSISRFSEVGTSLASALSNWGSAANRLAESLASFPTEVQVSHSPIPVIVSVSGLEGLESAITDKVMKAMDARMSVGKAKANDGKSPFFSSGSSR